MNARSGLTPERRAELIATLDKMVDAKDAFYEAAVGIGHHKFIEFAGFMGEYIKICRDTMDVGVDFTVAEVPAYGCRIEYIAEKFNCIFARLISTDPKSLRDFILRSLHVHVSIRRPPQVRRYAVGVVSAEEIAAHPTKSLRAQDYLKAPGEGKHGRFESNDGG